MADEPTNDLSPTPPARGYVVDPNFKPDPRAIFGSMRTENVGTHGALHKVAGIFNHAERRSLLAAARALDPNDSSVANQTVNIYPAPTVEQEEGIRRRIADHLAQVAHQITFEDQVTVSTTREPHTMTAIAVARAQGGDNPTPPDGLRGTGGSVGPSEAVPVASTPEPTPDPTPQVDVNQGVIEGI
jgi:hypothetical protein